MATITSPTRTSTTQVFDHLDAASWSVPFARACYALIFLLSAPSHFSQPMIEMAASQGIPIASFLVPASGVLAFLGGLSVLLGYFTRWGALALIVFLVPVTLSMHNFWVITDPQMAQMQMIHFMKNLSLLGGAVLLSYYGGGPISLDNHLALSRRAIG